MNKYKGFLLATAGGAVAMAGGAHAADLLPAKGPTYAPPPPVPAASWAGWYVGVNVGGAWQSMDSGYDSTGSGGLASTSGASFIGGGQIGYNWQRGSFVYGIEADISGLTGGPNVQGAKGDKLKDNMNWLATVRLRAGLAVDQTMVYMTGGVAVAGIDSVWNPNGALASPGGTKSDTSTRVGWVIGGGMEYMFNPRWTVGLEGLFVGFANASAKAPADPTKTTTFRNSAIIGRVKLNYKF